MTVRCAGVIRDCTECARLWEEYAKATAEFFRVDDRSKRAALMRDVEAMARLLIECETAANARADARALFQKHRTTSHRYDSSGETAPK
jgi:hypothetical protein